LYAAVEMHTIKIKVAPINSIPVML